MAAWWKAALFMQLLFMQLLRMCNGARGAAHCSELQQNEMQCTSLGFTCWRLETDVHQMLEVLGQLGCLP